MKHRKRKEGVEFFKKVVNRMQYTGEFYRKLYDMENDQMQIVTVTSNKE